MLYILLFLTGFGFAITGGVSIISYMNLVTAGLSWMDYFLFLTDRIECYLFPIGIIFLTIAIKKLPNIKC